MRELRTAVAIVGGGPAGLLLSQLLAARGIACAVLERASRAHVEGRVRAGVLEQGSVVDALCAAGVGERLLRERLVHHGFELRFGGASHRIDFEALVPGLAISVYGQREVVRDLIAAREKAGALARGELLFEAPCVRIEGLASEAPVVCFEQQGEPGRLRCEWVVGCDGFHGLSRHAPPEGALRVLEQTYPFAWLGILAQAPPSSHELIYAAHERGFALHSMRSTEVSRLYLQVSAGEDLAAWSDERIWGELRARLESVPGFRLGSGPILERSLAAMRSVVVEPMRHGRLLLAGDAAHIVPATGAKGLNQAIYDVGLLGEALVAWYGGQGSALLDSYSERCLERVWRVQQFSRWLTRLLHVDPGASDFEQRVRRAELGRVVSSRAAATVLAEGYLGVA